MRNSDTHSLYRHIIVIVSSRSIDEPLVGSHFLKDVAMGNNHYWWPPLFSWMQSWFHCFPLKRMEGTITISDLLHISAIMISLAAQRISLSHSSSPLCSDICLVYGFMYGCIASISWTNKKAILEVGLNTNHHYQYQSAAIFIIVITITLLFGINVRWYECFLAVQMRVWDSSIPGIGIGIGPTPVTHSLRTDKDLLLFWHTEWP